MQAKGQEELPSVYVPPPHDDGFVARAIPIPTQAQMPRTLPVYGLAQGGDDGAFEMNGSVLDYVEMPPALAGTKNPYGVYVSGESMSPRYEPGWLLHVHPHKPARPGDNVVVQIRARDEHSPPLAYVKVLVSDHHKSGGKLIVRQFNPDKKLVWEGQEVVSVHKIVGVAHE
ncbi:C repressor protein [Paramagnetospirillum caucaseum]|uniref:C repressor protein n=2 Tax=Paramagnetospirillum caucaseum TaxID=1244869 RepID=M2ZAI0_9PROT|nr:C repressor protein [Paramagnetospirillum caucaseum]